MKYVHFAWFSSLNLNCKNSVDHLISFILFTFKSYVLTFTTNILFHFFLAVFFPHTAAVGLRVQLFCSTFSVENTDTNPAAETREEYGQ